MMDGNTISLIQTQMNNERYNAQVYYYLAAACENMAYDGIGKFYRKQAEGELEHAKKFEDFLLSKRIEPEYRDLPAAKPAQDIVAIAKSAYELELKTTGDLSMVYELCDEPQVYALLQWFLVEQIEEETVTFDLFDLLSRTDAAGWIVLDQKYSNF